MRLWRSAHAVVTPAPQPCQHRWRLREARVALTGFYVSEVCDLCGALHIDGPETVTGPPTHVADGAALYLDSLERRSRPPSP